jgi:hypothetical protein
MRLSRDQLIAETVSLGSTVERLQTRNAVMEAQLIRQAQTIGTMRSALTELVPVAKKAFELVPSAEFGAAIRNAERAFEQSPPGGTNG